MERCEKNMRDEDAIARMVVYSVREIDRDHAEGRDDCICALKLRMGAYSLQADGQARDRACTINNLYTS